MTAPAPAPGAAARAALAARVFSLTGVVPLGAFLLVHLVVNARAVRGQEAFEAASDAFERMPALRAVEIALVYVPLALHGAMGLWMTLKRTPWGLPAVLPRAWVLASRACAVVTLLFLALHLPEMRVFGPGSRLTGGELLTILSSDLSSTSHGVPWVGMAYLLGTGAVTLHFAVGAWSFVARTRRGADARTRRVAAWLAAGVGAALWLLSADVVVLHATGARLFGSAAPPPVSGATCPDPASSTR